MTAILPPNQR